MLLLLIRDGFHPQKTPWLVHKIGQTPFFHPKTKWHCTRCTHSLPTPKRVASLLLSHLQPTVPQVIPRPGGGFAASPRAGQYFSLFIYIHGCGGCDQSYREGCSLGLCYAMHRNVSTCIFLVVKAGDICPDHQYLKPLLLLIATLLCQQSDSYLPKDRHKLYLS